jgi:hypothetical protein
MLAVSAAIREVTLAATVNVAPVLAAEMSGGASNRLLALGFPAGADRRRKSRHPA